MRIYIIKFFKPCKQGLKPEIYKSGFGKDLSLPLHFFYILLTEFIHDIYDFTFAKTLYSSVFKEIKFTIIIKF